MTIHTPGDPAAEDRVAVQALAVPAGRARQVTEFLTAQAGQPGLAAGQRTSVEARVRYLWNNQEYLRYDEALASPAGRSPPGWWAFHGRREHDHLHQARHHLIA